MGDPLDAIVHLVRPKIVYRCRKCGTLAYGHQVLPTDDLPPSDDCPCYMGPRWVRGVWFPEADPSAIDGRGPT